MPLPTTSLKKQLCCHGVNIESKEDWGSWKPAENCVGDVGPTSRKKLEYHQARRGRSYEQGSLSKGQIRGSLACKAEGQWTERPKKASGLLKEVWPGAPGTGSMQGCWAANVAGQPRKGGKEKGGGPGSLAWEGKQPSPGWERGLKPQTGGPAHPTLPNLCCLGCD